jgi:uncharacterized protein
MLANKPLMMEFGFECAEPVAGKIRFANTGELLLVTGKIHTSIKMECGRCLTEFTQPFNVDIEEEFRIEHIGDVIQALPLEEDDEAEIALISNNILNVTELVRQNLLLELPIQPLCNKDCKGLCPSCGENLNEKLCSCPADNIESPFQALAELLEDEEDK